MPERVMVEEILERFYEETGKNRAIEDLDVFILNPMSLSNFKSKELAGLLEVSTEIARKIIDLGKKGLGFDIICDSVSLLPSQCDLLKIVSKIETTKPKKQTKNGSKEYEIVVLSRLYHKDEDQPDSNFLGNSIESHQKILIHSNFGSFGISASKDIGEQDYFDSYKAFFSLNYSGLQLILGNFIAENNFGNILWNPFGKYKGSNPVIASSMFRERIAPTLTPIDYGTFRGIAIDYNFFLNEKLMFNFSGFVSKTLRSATVDTIRNVVTSIYTAELFRTPNELAKKNRLDELSLFGNIGFHFDFLSLNYSIFKVHFNKALQTNSKKYISGFQSIFHSFGMQFQPSDKITFSSEISLNEKNNLAFVSALTYKQKSFASSLNVRYFAPQFRSPFGTLFGENSYPNNEFGIFCGIEYIHSGINFEFYADYFRTLEPTTLVQIPIVGTDFYFQSIFTPFELLKTRVKIQRQDKTDYTYNIQKNKQIPFQKILYKFLIENRYSIAESLLLNHRLDFVYLNNNQYLPNETGWHTFIDWRYSPLYWLDLGGRINVFSTESFSSVIYVFEILSPTLMISQPFYDFGYKGNLWCSFKLFENSINVYLRYYYLNRVAKYSNFILGQVSINFQI